MAKLISNLPIGAKIKFGKHSVEGEQAQEIIWSIVAKSHESTPAYPSNSVTLLTSKIIDVRAIDAIERTNPANNRNGYGNNYYPFSNISQWLNSDAESDWYSAQHQYDAPPIAGNIYNSGGAYAHRPGFLYHFSPEERNAILNTTIRCVKPTADGSGYTDISTKVFLPSLTEVLGVQTNGISEGSQWGIQGGLACEPTDQVVDNTTMYLSMEKGKAHPWWTRTPVYDSAYNSFQIDQYGDKATTVVAYGQPGIRPALNVSSTLSVSDTTDSDGCYTIHWDAAPDTPTVNVLTPTVNVGDTITITIRGNDDSGGAIKYYILRSYYKSGNIEQIDNFGYVEGYSGEEITFTDIAPADISIPMLFEKEGTITYRIFALDTLEQYSPYVYVKVGVVHAPIVISGTDSDLGVKSSGFSVDYSATDPEGGSMTIYEYIDGVSHRSFAYTKESTFDITGETWLKLANGNHTLSITAYSAANILRYSKREYTFVKSVSSLSIVTNPITSATAPTRIKLNIARSIPSGADFLVEVCNNAFDTEPTWEDATSSVKGNLAYVFTNTTKEHEQWGVGVRVSVDRKDASGACYITSIGGNFE